MICNNIIDKSHLFQSTNKYIVDTNVIAGQFGHPYYFVNAKTNPKLQEAINQYNKAVNAKAKIYIPSIVISEYVNLYFTRRFEELKIQYPDRFVSKKKDYWPSQEYIDDCEYIKKVLKNDILYNIELIDDEFNCINIDQVFTFNNADFNDNLLIHIANKKGLFVISGDMDFAKLIIK